MGDFSDQLEYATKKNEVEALGVDTTENLEIIERRIKNKATKTEICDLVNALARTDIESARLVVYHLTNVVSNIDDQTVIDRIPNALLARRDDPISAETVMLFGSMISEQTKNPKIVENYFDILGRVKYNEEAKKLSENMIHIVLRFKDDPSETLNKMDEIAKWPVNSELYSVDLSTPLLFAPTGTTQVKTFSVKSVEEYAKNDDITAMLQRFEKTRDTFTSTIVAWNVRRLVKSLREKDISESLGQKGISEGEILKKASEATNSFGVYDRSVSQSAIWMIANVAKQTKDVDSIRDACELMLQLKDNPTEAKMISYFLVDTVSYTKTNAEVNKKIFNALSAMAHEDPKKAEGLAFLIKITTKSESLASEKPEFKRTKGILVPLGPRVRVI